MKIGEIMRFKDFRVIQVNETPSIGQNRSTMKVKSVVTAI